MLKADPALAQRPKELRLARTGLALMSAHADQALGQRLKELRLASRLSQEQLARAIGVSKATICQYEQEHIRIP
jgi:DNA-binding transcriptional regulator YiaG